MLLFAGIHRGHHVAPGGHAIQDRLFAGSDLDQHPVTERVDRGLAHVEFSRDGDHGLPPGLGRDVPMFQPGQFGQHQFPDVFQREGFAKTMGHVGIDIAKLPGFLRRQGGRPCCKARAERQRPPVSVPASCHLVQPRRLRKTRRCQ